MSTTPNVFLIGPMGAGKSAVGRQLARRLKCDFHDTDSEVERRTGVDIPFIFEKEGETGFRKREHEALDDLTGLSAVVVATGGGAVIDERNRQALMSRGLVVYLHATVDQQLERTRHSKNRPLLETEDPGERLRRLMTDREPVYRSIADYVIDTDGRRVREVAEEIRRWLMSERAEK